MNDYDSKSCNALEKPHYTPIEAAIRWCNLIQHESAILNAIGTEHLPDRAAFPQWPCFRANVEKIVDAIENHDLPYGRDGRKVDDGEKVAKHRRTVRHQDLKEWMKSNYSDQRPIFLFDDLERATHSSINTETFTALQADRDALNVKLEKTGEDIERLKNEISALNDAKVALEKKIQLRSQDEDRVGQRSETTYLNFIGAFLSLMLGESSSGVKNSVYLNQTAIKDAFLAHFKERPGISDRSIDEKFAEAKRSLAS